MAALECKALLLGPPQFKRNADEIRIKLRKAVALVAYLGVEKRSFSREYLATLLWPENSQASSLADLRRTLSIVRRSLGDGCIQGEGDQLRLNDQMVKIDTDEFAEFVNTSATGDEIVALERAAEIYRGDFLEGFNLGTCEEFDLWQDSTRQRLQVDFASVLERLSRALIHTGKPDLALPYAQRWLAIDNWNEAAHRTLMESLARAGRRKAAIQQFESCSHTLEDEGIDLDEETAELHRAILENRLPPIEELTPVSSQPDAESDSGTFLVGRIEEMHELHTAWSDVQHGRGRLVVISGEAGIGKTTLATEFCRQIAGAGARVLSSRLRDGFEVSSYWPWVQLITGVVSSGPEGPDGPDTTLHGLLRIDPDSTQLWLFDSVHRFFMDLAKAHPVVLIMDNFDLADPGSTDLLAYVAAGIDTEKVLLIATMRREPGHSPESTSARLRTIAACPCYRSIALDGLSRDETHAFLTGELADHFTPEIADAVFARTNGHPLFLEETIRSLHSTPESLAIEDTPARLQLAIGSRLDRLPDESLEYLMAAAVLGDDTGMNVLSEVAAQKNHAVLEEALKPCVDSGFLEDFADGSLRFRHALMRDVVYDHIPDQRRQEIHERAGDVLLAQKDARENIERISEHYSRVRTKSGEQKHKRCANEAGFNALRARAYHGALSHFRKVASDTSFEIQDQLDAEILTGMTCARYELSRLYLSLDETASIAESLRRVANYHVSCEDYRALAQFVVQTEDLWFHTTDAGTQRWVLRFLPESVSTTLSTFPIQHDPVLTKKAIQYHRRFLTKARRVGDPKRECRALLRLVRIEFFSNNFSRAWREFLNLTDMMKARSVSGPIVYDHQAGHSALDFSVWFPASRGDIENAEQSAKAFLENAQRIGWTRSVVLALLTCNMLSRSRGDFVAARSYLNQAVELTPNDPRILLLRAMDGYETGDKDAARRLAEMYLEEEEASRSYPTSLFAIGTLALLYRMSGKAMYADAAKNIQEGMGSKGPAELYNDAVTTGFALIAAANKDSELSAKFYRILRRCPRKMSGGLTISSDRVLGLLCASRGQSIRACRHFRHAARFCRKGFRPDLAWTCYDYAHTLLARRVMRRKNRAAALLEDAASLASELGMVHLADEISQLQRSLRNPVP